MSERVRNALIEILGEDDAADFSPEDVDKLERHGYTNARSLGKATREGLRHIHLIEARINDIVHATGEFPTCVLTCQARAWDHISPCMRVSMCLHVPPCGSIRYSKRGLKFLNALK